MTRQRVVTSINQSQCLPCIEDLQRQVLWHVRQRLEGVLLFIINIHCVQQLESAQHCEADIPLIDGLQARNTCKRCFADQNFAGKMHGTNLLLTDVSKPKTWCVWP